jgi:hypothetical protein
MGMPGGASLNSLSVAWVSYCEVLTPKRGFCVVALALFSVLSSHFQASENLVNKGFKGPFVIYTPILVFEWGQCYTRHFGLYIMDLIQIFANIDLYAT